MNNVLNQCENRAVKEDNDSTRNYLAPVVNIYENKDSYVLEAEMPGVRKEGLEVTLDGNELVILGRRTPEKTVDEVVYRESEEADYRRAFELDPTIDTTKINAKMDQGLLILTLPKAEAVKPRRITVND